MAEATASGAAASAPLTPLEDAANVSCVSTRAYVARDGDGTAHVEDILLCEPTAEEALVRMVAASICKSDIKSLHGKFLLPPPMIPGHEGAGIVIRVGSAAASRLSPGQHVVLSYGSCGTCRFCRTARPFACQHQDRYNFSGRRPDGRPAAYDRTHQPLNALFFGQSSFSRLALVHMSAIVPVDVDRAELAHASIFSCGIQTGASSILNVCKPSPGDTILIFGCGGVGLAAVMAARLTSPRRLIVVDKMVERLDLARSLGATHAIESTADIVPSVATLTDNDMCDYVLECAAQTALLQVGHACLANTGTLVIVGGPTVEGDTPPISIRNHLKTSKRLIGTSQGGAIPQILIPYLISLWREGQFPVQKLVTTYHWEELHKAVEDMESGRAIKPVIVFGDA